MYEILLSSLLVLRHKLHVFHWNVQGGMFLELHRLFQRQYEDALMYADRIAEYMRTKDLYISLSLGPLLIREDTDDVRYAPDMIRILMEDFAAISSTINGYHPSDRSINAILDEMHEWSTKQVWFLSSLLQDH